MKPPLLKEFKWFYEDLRHADLSTLDNIYTTDMVFRDPVHQLEGLVKLQDYLVDLCEGLTEYRVEYLDELVSGQSAYLKWEMHLRHRALGSGLISLRGMSHLQFEDKVYFHEDSYDMGAMLYEHIPLLGAVVRRLKRRLAGL